MSEEALAGLLGVSRKTVQRYESGARPIPPDVAAAVWALVGGEPTADDTDAQAEAASLGNPVPLDIPERSYDGTGFPYRPSYSVGVPGPIVLPCGDRLLDDDDMLPSPTVRAVADDEDGWAWLRVESQRWES
jgi:hypothetical protein